jgi:hypothetical protein
LEVVETAMFGIIKGKYKEIQDAFAYLGILPKSTKLAFDLIKTVRNRNRDLMNKFKAHLLRFYKLKKKHENIVRAMQIMEILKITNEASPAINQLFITGNYQTAIEIIENTEQLIAERLGSIRISQ